MKLLRSVLITPSESVERLQKAASTAADVCWLELEDGEWRVTHLGTNPLVVHGRETAVLEPGGTARLQSGDTLEVGGVLLEFVVRGRLPRRI